MLNHLKWKTLETRRFYTKVTLTYKIFMIYLPAFVVCGQHSDLKLYCVVLCCAVLYRKILHYYLVIEQKNLGLILLDEIRVLISFLGPIITRLAFVLGNLYRFQLGDEKVTN